MTAACGTSCQRQVTVLLNKGNLPTSCLNGIGSLWLLKVFPIKYSQIGKTSCFYAVLTYVLEVVLPSQAGCSLRRETLVPNETDPDACLFA